MGLTAPPSDAIRALQGTRAAYQCRRQAAAHLHSLSVAKRIVRPLRGHRSKGHRLALPGACDSAPAVCDARELADVLLEVTG